jgi:murein DD-endopeptidase MepM/ murein hydrolase activator NlpD
MRRRLGLAGAAALLLVLLLAPPASAAHSTLSKQVAAAQAQANAAAERLNKAETALALTERDVGDLNARSAALRGRLDSLEGKVKALAIDRYMGGASGLTLNASDPATVARTDAMIRFITLGATDALEAYRVAKTDFDATRRQLTQRLADRRAAVARLQGDRRKAMAELDRLSKALAALEAKEAAAKKGSSARPSRGRTGVIATGPWVCPVQGPHSFSNDYGAPRSGGRSHQGNDILAPRGTPVVANVAGVASENHSRLGGNSYFLKGKDGNTYFGAHLDSYTGAWGSVAAGTVLGYVGTTGDAQGGPPHLHFEFHPGGGAAVNPYPTLVKYC